MKIFWSQNCSNEQLFSNFFDHHFYQPENWRSQHFVIFCMLQDVTTAGCGHCRMWLLQDVATAGCGHCRGGHCRHMAPTSRGPAVRVGAMCLQ
jgi:hypothetical protein